MRVHVFLKRLHVLTEEYLSVAEGPVTVDILKEMTSMKFGQFFLIVLHISFYAMLYISCFIFPISCGIF